MHVNLLIPEADVARLDRARRSPTFESIPSRAELIRRFIVEGLARLEAQAQPKPEEART